jgi:hypothetical protein
LQRKGYTDITSIKNASDQGIDMYAKNRSGAPRFFEVKGHLGTRGPRLLGDQADIATFVQDRLQRAALGQGQWRNVDPLVSQTAIGLLPQVAQSPPRGFVINVNRALFLPRISVSRWR